MTTPDQLADDIDNAVARYEDADLLMYSAIDKAITAMRTAADALAAGANALHVANNGHLREAGVIDSALLNTAAQIRDLEVVQPEPTTGTWYGYTYSAVGKAGLAKPGIVRDFSGTRSIEPALITRTLNTGASLWYSWKPDLLSTTWLNNVESTLRSVVKPTHPPLYITVWHEPEGSTDAGGGTVTAKSLRWRNAHSALHAIVLRLRADGLKVYTAPIICDWTFWNTSKGDAKVHWYPKDWASQHIDVMGFDVYPQGQKAGGGAMIARLTTTGPNQVAPYTHDIRHDTYDAVRLCSQWAAECGKPWGSGETGIIDGSVNGADVQYPYSRAQRAHRFAEITADLATLPHPPLLWAWYNDGGCSVTNAPDTASVSVWNDSIATNPDGQPAVAQR